MSAIKVCLRLALCLFAFASIQCSVIRVQEIPLKPGVSMKIVIKDDPKTEGGVVASIKIGMDEKPKPGKDLMTKLIKDFVKPATGVVPDLDDRSSIGSKINRNCGRGEVRIGPICA